MTTALQIPEGWAATTLGELALWGSGGTPRRSEPSYFQGDIPWVTISDLNDALVNRTHESISQLGLENSSAKLVATGSVMVALYGSIGKLGIAAQKLATIRLLRMQYLMTLPLTAVTCFIFFGVSVISLQPLVRV